MAFDGITVAAVVQELEHTLVGGRISKIAQPENDELLLTIKGNGMTHTDSVSHFSMYDFRIFIP